MKIHELKRKNPNTKSRQVGRGGKRGKTSGHGTKGQKARAGHKLRPELRDIIKKVPKLRGYKFNGRNMDMLAVNVATLETHFENGDTVNLISLKARGILKGAKKGGVKILGTGDLSKKLTVEGCAVSATATEKITKAGGKVAEAK